MCIGVSIPKLRLLMGNVWVRKELNSMGKEYAGPAMFLGARAAPVTVKMSASSVRKDSWKRMMGSVSVKVKGRK
jgi:hypothetical protein